MPEQADLEKYYSTPQVAKMFDVKVGTVRDWIFDGLIEARKLPGGRWRIAESELRRFANERMSR
jgi:excisionase family DNA binding protein